MDSISISLTEKRSVSCCSISIFPAEYYDIPEVKEYGDFQQVKDYACSKLAPFKGKEVRLYLNGGMLIEVLSAIQAAAIHHIDLKVLHFNREDGSYLLQPVIWKPIHIDPERSIVSLTLCKGRHAGMPELAIFEEVSAGQMFDFPWQERMAEMKLTSWRNNRVQVYASGLTQLAVSVLNAAFFLKVPIEFYHYDYDTETYIAQKME